jgi:hypothetical protein
MITMMSDAIATAVEALEAERDSLMTEVNRLTHAIATLRALDDKEPHHQPIAQPPVPVPPSGRLSVKQMMLNLLYESGRDWSVNEILAEYENRGTPVQAKDPSNALRAAITEENKAGTIMRTAPGRYIASIYDAGPAHGDDSMDAILRGGDHPENDPQNVMGEMARSVRQYVGHNRFEEDAPG